MASFTRVTNESFVTRSTRSLGDEAYDHRGYEHLQSELLAQKHQNWCYYPGGGFGQNPWGIFYKLGMPHPTEPIFCKLDLIIPRNG